MATGAVNLEQTRVLSSQPWGQRDNPAHSCMGDFFLDFIG